MSHRNYACLKLRTRLTLAFAALIVVTGCGGGSETVEGFAQVSCSEYQNRSALLGVQANLDRVKVNDDMPVAITDAAGKVVGAARLGEEQQKYDGIDSFCERPFAAEVASSDFYGIQIADLNWSGIPASELKDGPVRLYGFYATSTSTTFKFAFD
jgi:hypothetical protein